MADRRHGAAPPATEPRLIASASALRADLARLSEIEFPRRFPIVQFPNAPLATGLVAGAIGRLTHGWVHDYADAIASLAIAVWAYEEIAHGANWFRRLLGATFAILIVVRVARALHG